MGQPAAYAASDETFPARSRGHTQKRDRNSQEHDAELLKRKNKPNTISPSIAEGTLGLYSLSEQENKDNTFKCFQFGENCFIRDLRETETLSDHRL